MARRIDGTLWARATNSPGKRAAISAGIVMALILIPWGIAEYSYQQRLQKLTGAVNRAISKAGGINSTSVRAGGPCSHALGALMAIDSGPCPRVGASVYVTVKEGEESAFLSQLLSDEGYAIGRVSPQSDYEDDYPLEGGGIKDGIGLGLSLINYEPGQPKSKAPDGVRWMRLNLSGGEPAQR